LILSINQLTSVPAEIGQLTSLTVLYINGNQLTSLPAEIATREFPLANSHRHS
jgi:leucine-rich repeat protein SHOC2